MAKPRKFICGNWKMNGDIGTVQSLMAELRAAAPMDVDMCVCPPFVHLSLVASVLPNGFSLGAQDCAATSNGAFTGDISASMVKDIGCSHVILGHSERRQYHGETDDLIAQKIKQAHDSGLIVILCVGETLAERETGQAEAVVSRQLDSALTASVTALNTIIAYEPVWAIGTGKVAEATDVETMHAHIRKRLDNYAGMRILYGGSVKPENAAVLLHIDNVDGALVGGASLKADQFLGIARAALI